MGFFDKIRESMAGNPSEMMEEAEGEDYVELGGESTDISAKIQVRPFVLHDFEAIKDILHVLREGHTVALINIRPLKDKDLVELKRAISKLKKTCDAIDGDIAGFAEDWIAATPSFAKIHRLSKLERTVVRNPQVTEYSSRQEEPVREEEHSESYSQSDPASKTSRPGEDAYEYQDDSLKIEPY
ncbi:MAG: cell division protein SepF [Nanoarchaeota archaeon]|nr:cell division protein SepF [Nanoarchaeota archaeon]